MGPVLRRPSPESVQTPYPYTQFYDAAQYTIDGDRLIPHYVTYPADGPVPTTQEFQRLLVGELSRRDRR